MGSGSSSAYQLSKEEASALDLAVEKAPTLKGKWDNLQAAANNAKEHQEERSPERSHESSVQVEASRPSEDPVLLKEEIARLKEELAQKEEAIQKLLQEADAAAARDCPDIFEALKGNNTAAIRHFARTQPDSVNKRNRLGDQPLAKAAWYGRCELVQLLLDLGASVDSKNYDGWTALCVAAHGNNIKVVEKLIAAGAATTIATSDGSTALHTAAWKGNTAMVELLLSAGAAVDAADNDGRTALHEAARVRSVDVVQKLITAGAALDAVDTKGETPYDLAKNEGHHEVMAVLDRVWVTLLSGRTCHCEASKDRTISELKDEAQSGLGLSIASLIGPDGKPLDEAKTLEAAGIRPGATLTAVIVGPAENEEGLGEVEISEDANESAEVGDEDHQGLLHDPKHFIEFLIRADVRLVRLEFLMELHQDGLVMPRRQEAESMRTKGGATALVELQEYRRLRVDEHSGHMSLDAGLGGQMATVHFRSVSHMWESMEHPDPWRHQLSIICNKYLDLLGSGLTWVFVDLMCLYQYKRNESQEISFQSALQMMHMIYSHEIVQVDILEDLTPENKQVEGSVMAYDEATNGMKLKPISELKLNPTPHGLRGWCQAEKEWARLRNMLQGTGIPTPPELFRHRMVNMKFTHRNDAEQVFQLQAKVFHAKISGTSHLHLEHLTATDLDALCDALPSYKHLKYVVVNGNSLTSREAVAVIESGAMDIQMESCELADEDAEIMAESLVKAARLKCLSLNRNRIGQRGLEALRKAMQERPDLKLTMEEQVHCKSKTEEDEVLIAGAGKQIED